MSTKRQPSKQRRQTQNQRQRAALGARREAAAEPTPATKVGTAPAGASSGSAPRSVLSRLRGAPTSQPASRAPRRPSASSHLPVGHRAALSALLAAVAGALVGSLLFKVPVDRNGDAISTRESLVAEWASSAADAVQRAPEATPAELTKSIDPWLPGGQQPYGKAYWPISAALLLPVLGAGLGFRAIARRAPAKVVNRTMYVTLFGSLLASQLSLLFLPSVLGLAVAAFQVRKAEMAAGRAAAAGDVIDVDAVEGVLEDDSSR